MFKKFLCYSVFLSLAAAFSADSGVELVINLTSNGSEQIYTRQLEVPARSESSFTLLGLGQGFLSYAVFQVHSHYFNVTLIEEGSIHQKGTNLGFILEPGERKRTIKLLNENYDDVQCLIAVVLYNKSAPKLASCGDPRLALDQTENFVIAKTGYSSISSKVQCPEDQAIEYFTCYTYLERMNFNHEVYFDGIKRLLFDCNKGFFANQVQSPFTRYFEKLPGTGVIINSIIVNSKGQSAFFIPAATYSCPFNTWNAHCSDINMLKQAFSVLLVIYSVVMILNLIMPELLEAAMNGMLAGSFIMLLVIKSKQVDMSSFEVFMTTLLGGLFFAAVCGTTALYFRIGRYLTKLTFSNLLLVMLMELLVENYTSLYLQFGGALILSAIFHFVHVSFSVFLGGLLMIIGLSQLLRVGNIHRMFTNNFLALSLAYSSEDDSIWYFTRSHFINYRIELNLVDTSLLIFYIVGSILLTARKEIYFRNHPCLLDGHQLFSDIDDVEAYNRRIGRTRRSRCIIGIKRSTGQLRLVSRCRRHQHRSNVINEHSPLISHWLASEDSDDDVFVSPNTNARFMQTLSPESQQRIDDIQKFDE